MLHEANAIELTVGSTDDDGSGPLLPSSSPTGVGQVVFEDDGETGYFYAVLPRPAGEEIADALHVYDVEQVTDRHLPCRAAIAWNTAGNVAALLINDHAHAVFDFTAERGWCRTGFPPPTRTGLWRRQTSHEWDATADALLDS
ncbi:hypothetical protein GCM10011519_30690 [Marmoricola endophyticus]|uniref:DUF2251 domain-containing protein n=1 Tax=Marmoricola endophyticus TaxID=2040280 RepID=A0A917F5W2_9ACTN|nr:DUF2251 domain-containing protein [Marmoricola endophyticus]GGF54647.1 hypothetical protein GCM10011519_30690 [Marmoricola endophyticus]